MRARLLGQRSNATVTELDRAYGGALAVYQNGEFESAIRTLKAIVDDLESLPETDESYAQWIRAQLRLAHAAQTIGREREADEAMQAVARTDPGVQPEPDQYSPTYRRRYDALRAKLRSLPVRRLQITSEGKGGTVYLNGRPMGQAPVTLSLPAGRYRVGGASGPLHVPSFWIDLANDDGAIVLDFALAEALRVGGGPGLALPAARRSEGIVRAGAWLGIDRVIAVSRVAEGDAVFLLGSIFDVRNGALLREGSVRTIAGTVPAANLGALATFLLTGQSSRDVKDRTELARAPAPERKTAAPVAAVATVVATPAALAPAPRKEPAAPSLSAAPRSFEPPPAVAAEHVSTTVPSGRGWMRPAAYASIGLGAVFTGLAIQQGLVARQASSDASAPERLRLGRRGRRLRRDRGRARLEVSGPRRGAGHARARVLSASLDAIPRISRRIRARGSEAAHGRAAGHQRTRRERRVRASRDERGPDREDFEPADAGLDNRLRLPRGGALLLTGPRRGRAQARRVSVQPDWHAVTGTSRECCWNCVRWVKASTPEPQAFTPRPIEVARPSRGGPEPLARPPRRRGAR